MYRLILPMTLVAVAAPALARGPAAEPSQAEKNAMINAVLPPDQAAMKAHVMFLASDQLKGRDAGSAEYDIAAQYVASQFYAAGLRPAGDEGGYLQKVPLVSYKPAGEGSFALARKGAAPVPLVFGEDYVPSANPASPTTAITAPLVFVGYGITAPMLGRDDYKGANLKGKIAVVLSGAPASFPSEERAHFGKAETKNAIAAEHGAVATITIESPVTARTRPFERTVAGYQRARFTWARPDGNGHVLNSETPSLGTLSLAGAAKLFDGARTPWTTIAKRAEVDGATFKPVALAGTLTATFRTVLTPVTSYNVAGMIPGSDPKLASEYVVLSAHLDHIGVGKPDARGDTINNGAMDDALGMASLIEEAKRFKTATPPRRSVLFLAVTAEEKGLVGSDYFANNPTVPKAGIVADVNLDMPILTYKFTDIIVYGAQRSTLGPIVERAAAGIGVTLSKDPVPDEAIFVRSDHYRFVQQGVPSVFLWPGAGNGGEAAIKKFLSTHYHNPSDEISQIPAIDWEQGVRFVDVNYRIAREIADGDERPVWNKGDYFGQLYKGPMAK